jgi:hypothetical protein
MPQEGAKAELRENDQVKDHDGADRSGITRTEFRAKEDRTFSRIVGADKDDNIVAISEVA